MPTVKVTATPITRDRFGRYARPEPKQVQQRVAKEPRLPAADERLVKLLPSAMQSTVREILLDPQTNDTWRELGARRDEFRTPLTALLASIVMNPKARSMFYRYLENWRYFALPDTANEVIIGGGLHAAIYAAVRVSMGKPPPVVLEGTGLRVGGAFACSSGPSFYLNSPNRAGELSIPGDMTGALNVLPGSIIQPSDISGREYMTNDDMAWIVRMTLAMNANVKRYTARNITTVGQRRLVATNEGKTISARRVIIATGLKPKEKLINTNRILTFEELMKRMDTTRFPLRGMKRVAVLGAGDSGKTAVEALVGQGPTAHASVAALDFPERIDWYGLPNVVNRKQWEDCSRSRYRGLGRFFSRDTTSQGRGRIKGGFGPATALSPGYNCIYIGAQPYDYLIDCRGYDPDTEILQKSGLVLTPLMLGGREVAKASGDIYLIGPAASIQVTTDEQQALRSVAENSTSIFRYAGRTAALAASLL